MCFHPFSGLGGLPRPALRVMAGPFGVLFLLFDFI